MNMENTPVIHSLFDDPGDLSLKSIIYTLFMYIIHINIHVLLEYLPESQRE